MADNLNAILDWLEAGRGGYTDDQLKEAFKKVANPLHWKMDIDAIVPADMKAVLLRAIPWHVGGGEIQFTDLGNGKLRVRATGYWSNGMEG